jgi:hypothetical protein
MEIIYIRYIIHIILFNNQLLENDLNIRFIMISF